MEISTTYNKVLPKAGLKDLLVGISNPITEKWIYISINILSAKHHQQQKRYDMR